MPDAAQQDAVANPRPDSSPEPTPRKLETATGSDTAMPSPARHLQRDLAHMIALRHTPTATDAKYPLKWTLLGAFVFCAAAWFIVASLIFRL
jgi:hypothetical protein